MKNKITKIFMFTLLMFLTITLLLLGHTQAVIAEVKSIDITEYGANGSDKRDDSVAIQKCLNLAKNNSGIKVIVPAGNYYLENPLYIYSNTSLVLDQNATIIRKNGDRRMISNALDEVTGKYGQGSNITIQGGKWDANSTDTTKQANPMWFVHAQNITLRDFEICNASGKHMVVLAGVKDVNVSNVHFSNAKEYTGSDAEQYYASGDGTYSEVKESYLRSSEALHIDPVSSDGSEPSALPLDDTPNENISVENCSFSSVFSGVGNHYSSNDKLMSKGLTIKNNTFKDIRYTCIDIFNQNDAIVENNTADNSVELARFRNSSGVMSKNVINTMAKVSNDAISLQGIRIINSKGLVICNNEINNPIKSGIHSENSTISVVSNLITGAKENGISLNKTEADITGNRTENCGVNGIAGTDGSSGKINDNYVGNITQHGIYVRDASISVSNNIVESTKKYGVEISDADKSSVIGNNINNTGKSAICVSNVKSGEINENTINCAYDHGIRLSEAVSDVKNNKIYDVTNSGISLVKNSTSGEISSNHIKDTTLHGIAIGNSKAKIVENKIENIANNGISVNSSEITVSNNSVINTKGHGISLYSNSKGEIIENNNISDTTLHGIYIDSSEANVRKNNISNTKGYGLVAVKGGKIAFSDNNIFGVGSHGIFVDNTETISSLSNVIDVTAGYGINHKNCKKSSINNNIIKNANKSGIALNNISSGDINNNYIYKASDHGIRLDNSKSNIINNYISTPKNSGISLISNSLSEKIKSNIIETPGAHGINTESSKATIMSNVISKPSKSGVLSNSSSIEVIDNNISNLGEHGIALYNGSNGIEISKNKISSPLGYGVLLNASEGLVSNNEISASAKQGIYAIGRSSGKCNNNTILKCLNNGIAISENSDIEISGNRVFNSLMNGISIKDSTSSVTENILNGNEKNGINIFENAKVSLLSDNTINNSGTNGIYINKIANDKTDTNILNNYIASSNERGIRIDESSLIDIEGNIINNSGTQGVRISKSKDCNISANTVYDNKAHGIIILESENINVDRNTVASNKNKEISAIDNSYGFASNNLIGNGGTHTYNENNFSIVNNTEDRNPSTWRNKITHIISGIEIINVDKKIVPLSVGDSTKINPSVQSINQKQGGISYISSNEKVAKVDGNGKVTAISQGIAFIKISTDNSDISKGIINESCAIVVYPVQKSISLNKKSLELVVGESDIISVTTISRQTYCDGFNWTSSVSKAVGIDNYGKVIAKETGTSDVTVTDKNTKKSAACKVQVFPIATNIILNKNKISMKVGGTDSLSAQVQPQNAKDKEIRWLSSNPSIVEVDNAGKIKAIRAGVADIIASSKSGITEICKINVSTDVLPSVQYTAKVINDKKWQSVAADGAQAGTTGQSKIMEAFRIQIVDKATGNQMDPNILGVKYRGHIQDYGWESMVSNNQVAGRAGEGKRIEALELSLTGNKAKDYDIYYSLHVQSYGWLNWAKNGQRAGTAALSKRVEAIRIIILPKGSSAPTKPGKRAESFLQGVRAKYSSKVIGQESWLKTVQDGAISGTTGKSLIMEAFKLDTTQNVKVYYRGHIQTYGWEDSWRTNGQISGRENEKKRIEAIQMKLDTDSASKYDIYYCMHVQNFGWLNWAKNGEAAGTASISRRVEAIAVRILPKGSAAPGKLGNQTKSFIQGVPATNVTLNKTSLTVGVGKTIQLNAKVTPTNVTLTKHSWKSSNTSVATVDSNGLVVGKKKGKTVITFKTQDGRKTAVCNVTVE